jgi:hypothetical protein
MDIKKFIPATSKPVQRNKDGKIVNDMGVTWDEWGANLYSQYLMSIKKIKKGALSEGNFN